MARYGYRPYVPVAQRRARAQREMAKLRKKGKTVEPIEIEGRTIARSFWGKGWCEHLESFSDFANRLPRGRTYVRNGSVCHLAVQPGRVEAIVSGSELYEIDLRIQKLPAKTWQTIKGKCTGQVGSVLELLQGKLSDQVMNVVTDSKEGLFPKPGEIKLGCSCPDFATMCKHVAAVLYGIGHRLDHQPELLFTLRGVDPQELITTDVALAESSDAAHPTLDEDQLQDVFGIELDDSGSAHAPESRSTQTSNTANRAAHNRRSKQKKPQSSRRTSRTTRANGTASTTRSPQATPNIRPTGKSVARLRRRMRLSVSEFADELGVTPATVYRWEATPNRLQLKSRTFQAIAAAHQRAKHT